MQNYRDQNFTGGYRSSLKRITLNEVEVALEEENSQATLGGLIETVVDQDQVWSKYQ